MVDSLRFESVQVLLSGTLIGAVAFTVVLVALVWERWDVRVRRAQWRS
jgi:hypothetical protein